jgi:hypothetical protein
MNVDTTTTQSFEKQNELSASYNYYCSSPQQYSPSTTESSSYYSVSTRKGSLQPQQLRKQQSSNNLQPKVYPLTLENLSKVKAADPSNMPLARYCNEIEASVTEPAYRPSSRASTKKTLHRRPSEDKVLESPRLLPFPYHNDSYFLPTAEHDYPGGCSSVATDASSSVASLSIHTMGSRQNLFNSHSTSAASSLYHRGGYQRQLLSSPSKSHLYSPKRFNEDDDDKMSSYSNKRRAASVTPSSASTSLREDVIVPQKRKMRRRSSNNKFALVFKQNLLRFKSNSPILECSNNSHIQTSASSIISKTLVSTPINDTTKVQQKRYEDLQCNNNTSKSDGNSWYEKLWKLLKPSSSFLGKRNSNATSYATTATGPVWYSQFRCNPPPPTGITLLS